MPKIEMLADICGKSFLTGSRVYGIPHEDSDIDLVVFFENRTTYWQLSEFAEPIHPNNHPSASDEEAYPSLRFDSLNIIPVFESELYEAWKSGTEFLRDEKPVSKKRAYEVLEEFRQRAKEAIRKRSSGGKLPQR